MSCTICDNATTVRSHIIPKAFAHEVRGDAKHIVAASRHYRGAKPSQGGMFSDKLLCLDHEQLTGVADKYAVEFVRRVSDAWGDRKNQETLKVDNPQPDLLRSFALITIWREVHAGQHSGLSLGPYEEAVRNHIFNGTVAPDWAVIVQRTNFVLPVTGAVDFNLHPYRVRFLDRTGWTMTVAGVALFVISDQRGLPSSVENWRADRHTTASVTVSEPLPINEVGALKSIISNIGLRSVGRILSNEAASGSK